MSSVIQALCGILAEESFQGSSQDRYVNDANVDYNSVRKNQQFYGKELIGYSSLPH